MKCSICGHPVDEHKHPITGKVYWTEGHNADRRLVDAVEVKHEEQEA